MAPIPCLLPVLLLLLLAIARASGGGYVRPKARETLLVPATVGANSVTPLQVHISMVGPDSMRVTWITEDNTPAMVDYWNETEDQGWTSIGRTSSYSYTMLYRSGNIHEVVVGPLLPGTEYHYRCGGNQDRNFSFKTPPADLPIKFVVVGDLGQTGWTNSTLTHISTSNYDVLLLPGDLSYADFYQPSWDSFARLVEPLASSRPWMVTHGNHEIESIPFLEPKPFKSYNARWRMPFEESASPSNLFYSFNAAAGNVHVLMLGSYTDFSSGSDQYKWLKNDLAKIDRGKTPWLIALIHAPWYNSNAAHQGEGEEMRKALEDLLYRARVDLVFAGHVHAYERFVRVYDNVEDRCGPLHITIGDGGNREGLASEYINPQPSISMFREASFGHGQLDVLNASHAQWTWHRNDDDEPVIADSLWITSLSFNPVCKKLNHLFQ